MLILQSDSQLYCILAFHRHHFFQCLRSDNCPSSNQDSWPYLKYMHSRSILARLRLFLVKARPDRLSLEARFRGSVARPLLRI